MPDRKAHVKRIFKIVVNPDTQEEALFTDIFVDVLRLEDVFVKFQSRGVGDQGQLIDYKLIWNDDIDNPIPDVDASNADLQFENANATRKTERRRISDPDVPTNTDPLPEGASDSATSIDDNDIYLWIVDRLKTTLRGSNDSPPGQINQYVFNNLPLDGSKGPPANRKVSLIKVVANDLGNNSSNPDGGLKMTDDSGNPIPVDWVTYKAALQDGQTDSTDPYFLTVEATDKFTVKFGVNKDGIIGQNNAYVLTNNKQDVEPLFEKGDPDAVDSTGKSAVIRIDPLQTIVNVGSNVTAVQFDGSETVQDYIYQNTTRTEASKITLSTWVYVSSDAVTKQTAAAKTLDQHIGGEGVHQRIPILQLGNSIEPNWGVHVGMSMDWEGFLGIGIWPAGVGMPSFPDYICDIWVGGKGLTRKGWFSFGAGQALPSDNLFDMWQNAQYIVGGVSVGNGCSFFYPRQTDPGYIRPVPHYEGFDNNGILGFNVMNESVYFPRASYSLIPALKTTWTFSGQLRLLDVVPRIDALPQRISLLKDDIAERPLLVESEILFQNFYSSDLNFTMQPTPTPIDGSGFPAIRVDTGGTGKYFAYGDLIVPFPKIPNVTYGAPAIPSGLYCDGDGNVTVVLTGPWPGKTTSADDELVPTLVFSAGGFKLDSWNNIYFTADLSTMRITGGQDDPTATTFFAGFKVPAGLAPPKMTTPPKWSMYVNGKEVTATETNPRAYLTVYPSETGHWSSTPTFNLALSGALEDGTSVPGQIGLPIIPQEVGRYKLAGPNRTASFAYTHIYFDKYIEPTKKNLSKFFWKSKNKDYNFVIPPPDKKAAVKAFGTPDVWLYRSKQDNILFQDNERYDSKTGATKKSASKFTLVGKKPTDFRPGPGQPKRKKK